MFRLHDDIEAVIGGADLCRVDDVAHLVEDSAGKHAPRKNIDQDFVDLSLALFRIAISFFAWATGSIWLQP